MSMHVTTGQPTHDDAQSFSSRIPGLSERKPHFWVAADRGEISYPPGGHASTAAVEQSSYWFNHRNAVIASVVARHPPEGMIVDIGGGNGYVSLGLRNAGFGSIVIEPGLDGANCAHDRGLPVIMAPYETMQVPSGAVAAAGLFDVLEHIEDDASAVRQLRSAIKPEGRLYLTVPANRWLWSTEDAYAGHFRRYTIDSLSKLVTAHGFVVEYATYFFFALVAPILAFRSLPTLLHLTSASEPSSMAADHRVPRGPAGKAVLQTLAWEARRIANGHTVPIGSSCLLVARRLQDQ